jgi:sporulation protein YlmC with PRC-barrel domain
MLGKIKIHTSLLTENVYTKRAKIYGEVKGKVVPVLN